MIKFSPKEILGNLPTQTQVQLKEVFFLNNNETGRNAVPSQAPSL
jgi:hypothetical protein